MYILIGDGDEEKSDRSSLLSLSNQIVGIGSGPHPTEGITSCIVYGSEFIEDLAA